MIKQFVISIEVKKFIGFFFILFLFFACKKDNQTENLTPNLNTTALKQWFANEEPILYAEDNWFNTLLPNWDKVSLLTVNDSVKVYEITLSNPNKIFVVTKNLSLEQAKNELSSNTQYRLLVFENLLNGKYNSCVMELVTYDNNLILNKIHYKDYKDLNGAVNFYEINGEFSNGWILDKGIIIRKATLNNNVDFNMLQIGGNTVGGNGKIMLADVNTVTCGRALVPHERTVCVGSGGIEGWGYDGSGGGMTCRQEIYYVSEVQYCQIPSYEIPDGGYAGGGGTSTTTTTKDIRNKTEDPCISKTVNAALIASKNIEGMLAGIIQRFDSSKTVTLNIFDGKTTNGSPGQYQGGGFTNGVFQANITLQTDYFKNSSKESVIATVIHEFVHAYIHTSGNKILESDHDAISNNYITPMATYLQSYFGIGIKDAYALAWSGVPDSKVWDNAPLDFGFTMSDGNKITKQETMNLSGPFKDNGNEPQFKKGTPICN